MAGLDHRAAEDHRSTDRSHRARRERSGRVPCGDPVDAGLRVLRQADQHRLGPRADGPSLGRADEAPRLQPLRRPRRRLGRVRRRPDGLQAPEGLLAIHTNMPGAVPADLDKASLAGEPAAIRPLRRGATRVRPADQTYTQVEYARMMAARPQTLYGIADSPVGLAAWLLDHNDADGQPAAAGSRVNRTTSATGELTRDEVLDNITLYWLTNTGVSASRLYWEYRGRLLQRQGRLDPGGRHRLPAEQYQAPRSWAERAYPNLIYFNEVDKGGHFAAWEAAGLFSEEIRAAFRSLRQGGRHEQHRRDRQPDPPVQRRHCRRGTGRPAPAHRSDALALQGAGRRSLPGRAARDHAGARPLLGHRLRPGGGSRRG